MFENDLLVLGLLLVNLIVGFGVSYYFARRRYRDYEQKITSLEETVSKSTEDLRKTRTDYNDFAENTKNRISELEESLKKEQSIIDKYKADMVKAVENIETLTSDVEEKNNANVTLQGEVDSLDEANKLSTTRAIEAEGRVQELSILSQTQEKEISVLKSRMLAMQDNLSHLLGIGPRVSSILQASGVDSFAKLASTDQDKINEILAAANPNLLRLTDSSTWSEQASLAAEGKWDDLKRFQDEIKKR